MENTDATKDRADTGRPGLNKARGRLVGAGLLLGLAAAVGLVVTVVDWQEPAPAMGQVVAGAQTAGPAAGSAPQGGSAPQTGDATATAGAVQTASVARTGGDTASAARAASATRSGGSASAAPATLADIDRLPEAAMSSPPNVPPALNRTEHATVRVDLQTVDKTMKLADGTEYTFWTFNGTVPGPFIRVREGDTVAVRITNATDSSAPHSIDLHAVTGSGGGAVHTQTSAGKTTAFVFQALKPGLYVYHCATPPVPMHIANGMYGMILVEPAQGLPEVDREFYVMQQEVYTAGKNGAQGLQSFDWQALWDERPEYVVFNGAFGALTGQSALRAKAGETVRIYFGVGGPNLTSSFHVIGEIFDRVYNLASLTAAPLTDVQTVTVPPGGAVAVDFKVEVPGTYTLVDHALGRIHKGAAGELVVEGEPQPGIYRGLK